MIARLTFRPQICCGPKISKWMLRELVSRSPCNCLNLQQQNMCVSAMWSAHWSWWWQRTIWLFIWTEPRPTEECLVWVGWKSVIRWLTGGASVLALLHCLNCNVCSTYFEEIEAVMCSVGRACLTSDILICASGSGRIWNPSLSFIRHGSSGLFWPSPNPSSGKCSLCVLSQRKTF